MNRERFAEHHLVGKFFDRVVAEALAEELASEDHFTVDGTLIRSWASLKSLEPRPSGRLVGPVGRSDPSDQVWQEPSITR